jgi:hypothetical protein
VKDNFVSTVGWDEDVDREYLRNQEQNDEHRDQMKLGVSAILSPLRKSPPLILRLCQRSLNWMDESYLDWSNCNLCGQRRWFYALPVVADDT